MITMTPKVVYRGIAGVKARQFNNEFLKPTYHAAGQYWLRTILPKHFTHQGATEYGYTKRSGEQGTGGKGFKGSYTGRKLRKFGHTLPLVYTGELRLRARTGNIIATSRGVRVRLTNAQKANLRNPHSKINMAEEMRRLSPADMAGIGDVINRELSERIAAHGGRALVR